MFFNSKRQRYTLTILAMSALTACGGGGGGSNPLPDAITSPVTTTANVTTATASAGLSFIASGRAESQILVRQTQSLRMLGVPASL